MLRLVIITYIARAVGRAVGNVLDVAWYILYIYIISVVLYYV